VRAPYVLYHLWDDLDCREIGSSSDNIVNLVVAPTHEQGYVNDENDFFYGDKHHITLFGKKKMINRTLILNRMPII
jgi:hypothetical protein